MPGWGLELVSYHQHIHLLAEDAQQSAPPLPIGCHQGRAGGVLVLDEAQLRHAPMSCIFVIDGIAPFLQESIDLRSGEHRPSVQAPHFLLLGKWHLPDNSSLPSRPAK